MQSTPDVLIGQMKNVVITTDSKKRGSFQYNLLITKHCLTALMTLICFAEWPRKVLRQLSSMHFSWQKHLDLSRNVSNAADKDSGIALALMGIALTILAKDLLAYELQNAASQDELDLSQLFGWTHQHRIHWLNPLAGQLHSVSSAVELKLTP